MYNCPEDCGRCSDTDSGIDYYTKGIVDSAFYGQGIDNCAWENSEAPIGNVLNEWFCRDGVIKATSVYACPNGCQKGACIS